MRSRLIRAALELGLTALGAAAKVVIFKGVCDFF